MAIPHGEDLLTFRQAIAHIPPRHDGRPVRLETLYRWSSSGIGGVRLEWTRAGGTRCTSIAALRRFFDRLAADAVVGGGVP
jgi:hypothetical protein